MKYIATPCTGSIRHARKGMQMERVPFGNHLPRVPNLCGSHRPLCTGHLGQANGAECHSARLTGSPHPALHQHTPRTSFSSLNTWLPAVQTLRMEPPKKKVQEKQEVRAGCTPHLSKLVNSQENSFPSLGLGFNSTQQRQTVFIMFVQHVGPTKIFWLP